MRDLIRVIFFCLIILIIAFCQRIFGQEGEPADTADQEGEPVDSVKIVPEMTKRDTFRVFSIPPGREADTAYVKIREYWCFFKGEKHYFVMVPRDTVLPKESW